MNIDFSKFNINHDCFNKENDFLELGNSYLDPNYSNHFHKVCEIILLETSSRKAREIWQLQHLNNLLKHASTKSFFWRKRLPSTHLLSLDELKNLPILTREDVRIQVSQDGCLIPEGALHYTSGSSGIPIKFYCNNSDAWQNVYRTYVRHIIGKFNLNDNQTLLKSVSNIPYPGFQIVDRLNNILYGLTNSGLRRVIKYSNPDILEFKKMISSEKIGHLGVNPYMMDTLVQKYPIEEMKKDGLTMWIPVGGNPSEDTKKDCKQHGIRIAGSYSSEEIGMIGYECNEYEEHYHVSGSNVIVECVNDENLEVKNTKLGRLLITRINSKSTPFIRYDIGDIGELLYKCPCGHDGQTIRNLYGRRKNLVKRLDGTIWPFLIQIKNHKFMTDYKEFRLIQTEIDTIRIQIGGVNSLSKEEIDNWAGVVYDQMGRDGINIEIELLDQIDWGESTKKVPFKSLVI